MREIINKWELIERETKKRMEMEKDHYLCPYCDTEFPREEIENCGTYVYECSKCKRITGAPEIVKGWQLVQEDVG